MRRLLAGFVVLASGLAVAEAEAACNSSDPAFAVNENSQVDTYVRTSSAGCTHGFVASAVSAFTSATVARSPSNGSLTRIGPLRFQYRAKPGFRGEDRYGIRLCGTRDGSAGCTMINYHMTVQ